MSSLPRYIEPADPKKSPPPIVHWSELYQKLLEKRVVVVIDDKITTHAKGSLELKWSFYNTETKECHHYKIVSPTGSFSFGLSGSPDEKTGEVKWKIDQNIPHSKEVSQPNNYDPTDNDADLELLSNYLQSRQNNGYRPLPEGLDEVMHGRFLKFLEHELIRLMSEFSIKLFPTTNGHWMKTAKAKINIGDRRRLAEEFSGFIKPGAAIPDDKEGRHYPDSWKASVSVFESKFGTNKGSKMFGAKLFDLQQQNITESCHVVERKFTTKTGEEKVGYDVSEFPRGAKGTIGYQPSAGSIFFSQLGINPSVRAWQITLSENAPAHQDGASAKPVVFDAPSLEPQQQQQQQDNSEEPPAAKRQKVN